MLKALLQIIGWLLAHTPEFALRAFASGLGQIMLYFMPRRRRLMFSNLHHAFPERSFAWQRTIASQSSRNLIETALLSLATPFLSDRRLKKIITPRPSALAAFAEHKLTAAPVLFASPHIAYWEAQTALPLVIPAPFPEFGIIFRPLDNPTADTWVKRTRGRFGMKLLSRREGFQDAMKILRRKGFIGLLFDQNAGPQGALSTLFGRVCSTTELSGLLASKFEARVYGIYPRRLAFWRIDLSAERVDHDGTAANATLGLNRWLEKLLTHNDDLCASWLWAHDRWRNQDIPEKRLRLQAKRTLLPEDLASCGLSALPRKTRFWIRMPNWLGDVVITLPVLRALRLSRPDAQITLIAKASFLPFLAQTGVADHLEALPSRGLGYFRHFWKLRRRYPDITLLFTHSTRGDLEAWLTRVPQRFGVQRANRSRPLLTHHYRIPPLFDEKLHHQIDIWEAFFRHFGLEGTMDRSPLFQFSAIKNSPLIFGFIAGSENNPEKRWPVSHWRDLLKTLLRKYPFARVLLFGTAHDKPITAEIASGLDATRVDDLAGKTDLSTYMIELSACTVLVTNDTGGMHLANAMGVPLVGLFGPTNPVRTGPVFSGPFILLQPPGSPPTGGRPLSELAATTVAEAVQRFLPADLARE